MSWVLRTASCTLITRPRFELAPGSPGPSSVGPPHRGEEQRAFQLRNEERRGPSHPEQPGGAPGRREPALCGQKTRGCRVCSPPRTRLCEGLLEASRSVQAAPRCLLAAGSAVWAAEARRCGRACYVTVPQPSPCGDSRGGGLQPSPLSLSQAPSHPGGSGVVGVVGLAAAWTRRV